MVSCVQSLVMCKQVLETVWSDSSAAKLKFSLLGLTIASSVEQHKKMANFGTIGSSMVDFGKVEQALQVE